jgi:hypothetical protein
MFAQLSPNPFQPTACSQLSGALRVSAWRVDNSDNTATVKACCIREWVMVADTRAYLPQTAFAACSCTGCCCRVPVSCHLRHTTSSRKVWSAAALMLHRRSMHLDNDVCWLGNVA